MVLAQGSEPRSIRGPMRPRMAGSSVSVAARMKMTLSMIPRAIERNAGLLTSMTALSEISTVRPLNITALPAVSIVVPTASRTRSGSSGSDPCRAARKRMTTNSA